MALPSLSQGLNEQAGGNRFRRSLIETELASSLDLLIRLRWFAGLGVIILTLVIKPIFGVGVPRQPLITVGVLILFYNLFFFRLARSLRASRKNDASEDSFPARGLAIGQMICDWISTIMLIHFSGGIESPVTYFFLFHIIIASIFFTPRLAYTFAGLAFLLLVITAGLEYLGWAPHYTITGYLAAPLYQNTLFVLGSLFFFGFTAAFVTYLATGITERLRARTIEVVELSESLQRATQRLQVLNESARAISSTLQMEEVLNLLVKNTAEVMNAQACSIRLIDQTGQRLDLVANYGLSEGYQNKGPVMVANSALYSRVLQGQTINIPDVSQADLLQYPQWAISEGYWSILTTPLVGKDGIIGTLRAYSKEKDHFNSDDEAFLTAIAAQGSSAIENAQAYKAIASLEASKSTFVRIFTHELRSPVGVIQSLLRNISEGYAGAITDQQRDLVNRAIKRADFMQTLIDDLLDLAAGKVLDKTKSSTEAVQLTPVLERLMKRFEIPAQEKNISLRLENHLTSENVSIMATTEGVDRVLNNLISNGIKYTLDGGSVLMRVSESGGYVRVSVQDTGIGIPEEALPNLFNEFYRAPNAKQIEAKGTGLGLTILKDLVTSYGGQVFVESKLGVGSTFKVTFPKANQPVE
jgi:signal transduction histidine kinase